MAVQDRVGFEVGDEFYPLISSYKMTDPALVEDVAGLDWIDFLHRAKKMFAPDDGEKEADYRTIVGLIAIAVWRANPGWRRERVIRYMQDLDQAAFEFIVEGGEDDAGPPEREAGSTPPSTSAKRSDSDSDSTSEQSTPQSSGTPTSPTSPEEPSE